MFVKFGTYIVCYMLYLILGVDNAENNSWKSQIQDGGPIGGHFGFWHAKIHFLAQSPPFIRLSIQKDI